MQIRKSIIVFIIAIFCLFIQTSGFSQAVKWENYTDMKEISQIAVTADNVAFCGSKGGIFSVNLYSGLVLKKYTNINGLLNNDVLSLTVDNQNRIWIGATDGSISIYDYTNDSWKYIYDIKNSSESDKSINSFVQYGNFMFVATGYGIQKISISNFSFIDAPYYQLGNFAPRTKVNVLTILNNTLFAGTTVGAAYANLINSNLNSPSSWNNFNSFGASNNVITLATFDNKVFAGLQGSCMFFENGNWNYYPNSKISSANVRGISSIQNKLYLSLSTGVYTALQGSLENVVIFDASINVKNVYGDKDNNPVLTTLANGIYRSQTGGGVYIFPNGPPKNSFDWISINENGVIWSAAGQDGAGFSSFDSNIWTNYTTFSHPQIGSSNFFRKIYTQGNSVWALSFGGGPTLIEGSTIRNFNPSNSSLPGVPGAPNFCTPFGGAFDNNGRFWMSFYGSNNSQSIYCYTGDNNFVGIPNSGFINSAALGAMVIDNYNTKWVVSRTPYGLYFYNENNTLTNFSDDVYGFYSTSDFGSGISNIYDVTVDKNGEIWAASNNGVFIIANPLGAIQNPNNKPVPVKLGLIEGNLRVPFTELCLTISTDILNNKWIGTERNGVFHLSSDGSTLIEQFNTTNSPILDNQINRIEVSNKTGIAYFATLKGLSSVTTNAIEPVAEFDEITCSPNPFLLPANVDLKINGLIENSFLKIITLTGDVVAEFESPGGRIATWTNSRNINLASGVYIVVAFNKDGSKVGKGKFAVVRK
jgi:ligand-binding sensor domain-containing protein